MKNYLVDREKIFPFFKKNKNIIFFDSALTTLKPQIVLDEIINYYTNLNYSTFRSVNIYAERVNKKFDESLKKIANFLNINTNEIIFTSGTTDALNSLARVLIKNINQNDEIILGEFEHASNFLPWKEYGKDKNIKFNYYKLDNNFEIDIDDLKSKINKKTKIVSVAHVFNTLGSKNNIKRIKEIIKEKNKDCILVVDGAQAVGHIKVDLKDADVDAYVFSGHKFFAENGIGICFIKYDLMKKIEPFNYGGGNNIDFGKEEIIYKEAPNNFFSGTLNYPGIFSISAAINFINEIGIEKIEKYCNDLKFYAEEKMKEFDEVRIVNKNIKSSILLLESKKVPGEDIAYILGKNNILLRNGTSCVKIKNDYFDKNKAIRLSFHLYNTKEDIDKFIEIFRKNRDFLEKILGNK